MEVLTHVAFWMASISLAVASDACLYRPGGPWNSTCTFLSISSDCNIIEASCSMKSNESVVLSYLDLKVGYR